MPRTSRLFTPGRVLFGLLIAMNVVLCAVLVQSSRRSAALERELRDGRRARDDGALPGRPSPSIRAARRAGQSVEGLRRDEEGELPLVHAQTAPAPAAAGGHLGDGVTPPDDPEVAYDRLIGLVQPTADQEQVMRDAFDKHYPAAEAAYRAHDLPTARAAWRAYCDEVASTFDGAAMKKLGCVEPPPPPTRDSLGLGPAPAPPQPLAETPIQPQAEPEPQPTQPSR